MTMGYTVVDKFDYQSRRICHFLPVFFAATPKLEVDSDVISGVVVENIGFVFGV